MSPVHALVDELLAKGFAGQVRIDEPMSRHTTYGIGGPADLLMMARDLRALRMWHAMARQHGVPVSVLGRGSNVLVSDAGVRGLVIINACAHYELDGHGGLWAEAGGSLPKLARFTAERGWKGLEWAIGIPGTIGGAVVGNAGAFGGCMADIVCSAALLNPDGSETKVGLGDLGYDYRTSVLRRQAEHGAQPMRRPIVLGAMMQLHPAQAAALMECLDRFSAQRSARQPVGRSAGSVFRRTDQYPAGFLIDQAGLKGLRVGGAIVSPKHANFILNTDGATACDVLRLMETVRQVVWDRFGEALESEIELFGDWTSAMCDVDTNVCLGAQAL